MKNVATITSNHSLFDTKADHRTYTKHLNPITHPARTPLPTLPDGALSDGALSDGTLSDGTLSDGTLSDGTLPDGTLPDGTLPDGTLSDGTLSDNPCWLCRQCLEGGNTRENAVNAVIQLTRLHRKKLAGEIKKWVHQDHMPPRSHFVGRHNRRVSDYLAGVSISRPDSGGLLHRRKKWTIAYHPSQ